MDSIITNILFFLPAQINFTRLITCLNLDQLLAAEFYEKIDAADSQIVSADLWQKNKY